MADDQQLSLLLDSASRFPLPQGLRFSYGTAGFRSDGSVLSSTVHRAGILSALRSLKTQSTVGLVITASHNPVGDNGVKITDPDGGMLDQSWEPFADSLANASVPNHLVQLIVQFAKDERIPLGGAQSAEILLARDTRPTGETLIEAAKQGINAIIGAVAIDMGILTTPQLHWMVRYKNRNKINASESDYFTQLSKSLKCLMDLVPKESTKLEGLDKKLIIDGANGVGGSKLEVMKEKLTGVEIEVRNTGKNGEGILNEKCGADYVQKEKAAPCGFSPNDVGIRCASLDGDADRLVYFRLFPGGNNKIELADGDKILSLFSIFIKEQLEFLGTRAKLGVVQTAYANGASTDYLTQLGLEVVFTPTGVKYLHKKASEFDIGIYFEANGHGTILFSEDFLSQLESFNNEVASTFPGTERQKAASRLVGVSQLINQAVGDALSGLLLVEAILQYKGWTFQNWCDLYTDLPSKQLKVKVVDRSVIITANAETTVVEPSSLQDLIDTETAKYPRGRCFVRPSGTEDVVRIYAEASTQEAADSLAHSVALHVDRILGSGGPH